MNSNSILPINKQKKIEIVDLDSPASSHSIWNELVNRICQKVNDKYVMFARHIMWKFCKARSSRIQEPGSQRTNFTVTTHIVKCEKLQHARKNFILGLHSQNHRHSGKTSPINVNNQPRNSLYSVQHSSFWDHLYFLFGALAE